MPQPLGTKESNLFRQVIRNYEEKQYKRGLKAAEQILRKNPKHGDTMAMKALILNAQGRTDEAFALGKEALTADMKSHICWHVYGLLYRSAKNFEEAIKAYKFALRLEPESPQIQRDLAFLQIQMRDYQGYVQSRSSMLQARPQLRQSWTGLAIAHHLAGNLADAEAILTKFEDTLKVQPGRYDLEHSEAIMYKNMIIAESGDYERALQHLEDHAAKNLDQLAVFERRADYLDRLGRKDPAEAAWRALVDRNPDHPEYYNRLITTLALQDDPIAKKAIYDEYAAKYPRSDAAKRLPLDFLSGDAFRDAARGYLTFMLNKGVPSTFANLKHLYADDDKKAAIPALVQEYLQSVKSNQDEKTAARGESSALYFLAQHFNYHRSRDLAKATEYLDKAIALEPSNVDYAMTRARIWKHHGNLQKASEAMDHARTLDLKDRYINTKAAKYQLRNNENERAIKTIGMFTRADTPGGPLSDLLDMQAVWYFIEDGEAHARAGNVGMALKRLHTVYNIFETWQEDQFDFHSFSLRKGLPRAYVDMIRWEDILREHPIYSRAALAAIQVYTNMYDRTVRAAGRANGTAGSADGPNGGSDASEAKKAAKKAKKEAARLEKEAAERAAKEDPNKPKQAQDPETLKKKDDDPTGQKLAASTDPLGMATKFLGPLLELSPKLLDAQLAGLGIYLRRNKYVLAAGCYNAARALDPEHPEVHEGGIALRLALDKATVESLPEAAATVLKSEFTAIPATSELQAFNDAYKQSNARSASRMHHALRVDTALGQDRDTTTKALVSLLGLDDITRQEAADILETLKQWQVPEAQEEFRAGASAKWPEATVFQA